CRWNCKDSVIAGQFSQGKKLFKLIGTHAGRRKLWNFTKAQAVSDLGCWFWFGAQGFVGCVQLLLRARKQVSKTFPRISEGNFFGVRTVVFVLPCVPKRALKTFQQIRPRRFAI